MNDRGAGRAAVSRQVRLLALAGIPTGLIVAGVGSRVAMLILRMTTGDRSHGVVSDDGFEIGRFTLAGSYNLLLISAVVGIIGAAAYQWVRPWLLGPRWFRIVTLAMGAGAVVGAMLIHAEGIDFVLLDPTWLAIALFVLLPALFGAAIEVAVEAAEKRIDALPAERRSWVVPTMLAVLFPPTLVLLAFAAVVFTVWRWARQYLRLGQLGATAVAGATLRLAWLGVAVFGLVTLLGDIADIYERV